MDGEADDKSGVIRSSSTWAKGSTHAAIWKLQANRELTIECPDDTDLSKSQLLRWNMISHTSKALMHPLDVAVNMQKIRFVSKFDAFQRKMSGIWNRAVRVQSISIS